jgi:hypothetical protein
MARNYKVAIRVEENNRKAKEAEKAGDTGAAIRLYEANIKYDYADRTAFERLMVIYRRQKKFRDEVRVIDRGLELFQQLGREHTEHALSRRVNGKKLAALSRAILRKSGLQQQQSPLPEPLNKWLKRKEIAQNKVEDI